LFDKDLNILLRLSDANGWFWS